MPVGELFGLQDKYNPCHDLGQVPIWRVIACFFSRLRFRRRIPDNNMDGADSTQKAWSVRDSSKAG